MVRRSGGAVTGAVFALPDIASVPAARHPPPPRQPRPRRPVPARPPGSTTSPTSPATRSPTAATTGPPASGTTTRRPAAPPAPGPATEPADGDPLRGRRPVLRLPGGMSPRPPGESPEVRSEKFEFSRTDRDRLWLADDYDGRRANARTGMVPSPSMRSGTAV